jgi:hypothetical protein
VFATQRLALKPSFLQPYFATLPQLPAGASPQIEGLSARRCCQLHSHRGPGAAACKQHVAALIERPSLKPQMDRVSPAYQACSNVIDREAGCLTAEQPATQ